MPSPTLNLYLMEFVMFQGDSDPGGVPIASPRWNAGYPSGVKEFDVMNASV
jgi:hypothetical protein